MYESVRFYRQIETPSIVATPAAAATLDAATLAWVTAVIANGGTVSAGRETLVDNLITGLKADGVWTKLDRLWLHAGENQASALTDLVADSLATAVNSPTFTTDRGFAGDGATNYINTNFVPSTDAVKWTTSSGSIAGWAVVADATSHAAILGADDTNTNHILQEPAGWFPFVNSNFVQAVSFGNGPGLIHAQNDGSTVSVFGNGASKDSGAGGTAGAIPTVSLFVLARNLSGSPTLYAQHQISAIYAGSAMTDPQVAAMYSRLRTYMTAVGVP